MWQRVHVFEVLTGVSKTNVFHPFPSRKSEAHHKLLKEVQDSFLVNRALLTIQGRQGCRDGIAKLELQVLVVLLQAQLLVEALDRRLKDAQVLLGHFEGLLGGAVVGLGDFGVPSKVLEALLCNFL